MLLPRSYDPDANAPDNLGYGLGLMIEPARPGERFGGHAGSGPGSTITVFSALTGGPTFAASVGTDAPDTFPKLIEYPENARLAFHHGLLGHRFLGGCGGLCRTVLELKLVEAVVNAPLGQQLLMRA